MKLIILFLVPLYILDANSNILLTKNECGVKYASPLIQILPNITIRGSDPLFWNANDTALGYGNEFYWMYNTGLSVYFEIKELHNLNIGFQMLLEAPKYQSIIGHALTIRTVKINPKTLAYQISAPKITFKLDQSYYINCGHSDRNGLLIVGLTSKTRTQSQLYSVKGNKTNLLITFNRYLSDFAWNYNYTMLYAVGGPYILSLPYYSNGTVGGESVVLLDKKHQNNLITGIEVDSTGTLWLALAPAGIIMSVDIKSQRILFTYPVQPLSIKSLTFGGPNLDQLYFGSVNLNDDRSGCAYVISGFGVKGNTDNYCRNDQLLA